MSATSWKAALARGGAAAFSVRIAGTAIALGTQVLLARWMGVEEYGAFVYVYTWSLTLGLLAKLGTDRAVVRFGAPLLAEHRHAEFAGLSRMALRWPALVGTLIALGLVGITMAVVDDPRLRHAFATGACAIPLLALHHVHLAFGQARKRVWLATIPEQLLRQGLLGALAAGWLFAMHEPPDAVTALELHVAAVAATLLVARAWHVYTLPGTARVPASAARPEWLRYSMQMTLVANLSAWLVQVDVLLVGLLIGASAAGVYSVASRMALLLPWVSLAALTVFAPVVAELAAAGRRDTLQQYATTVARAVALVSTVLAAAIWAMHPWILGWFGPEYLPAAMPLAILLCGYVLQDYFGPVAALMNLSGHQTQTLRAVALGMVACVSLQWLFIPVGGVGAAALVTAAVTVGNAAVLWLLARQQIGVDASVLGRFTLPRA